MNEIVISSIRIGFLVIAFAMALVLALCVYIYIRYGRTPSITIMSSALVVVFFIIAIFAAFSTLQNLISLYA